MIPRIEGIRGRGNRRTGADLGPLDNILLALTECTKRCRPTSWSRPGRQTRRIFVFLAKDSLYRLRVSKKTRKRWERRIATGVLEGLPPLHHYWPETTRPSAVGSVRVSDECWFRFPTGWTIRHTVDSDQIHPTLLLPYSSIHAFIPAVKVPKAIQSCHKIKSARSWSTRLPGRRNRIIQCLNPVVSTVVEIIWVES